MCLVPECFNETYFDVLAKFVPDRCLGGHPGKLGQSRAADRGDEKEGKIQVDTSKTPSSTGADARGGKGLQHNLNREEEKSRHLAPDLGMTLANLGTRNFPYTLFSFFSHLRCYSLFGFKFPPSWVSRYRINKNHEEEITHETIQRDIEDKVLRMNLQR